MSAVMDNTGGAPAGSRSTLHEATMAAADGKAETSAPALSAAPAVVATETKRRRIVGADTAARSGARSPLQPLMMAVVPPLVGLAFLILVWEIVAAKNTNFPTPTVTLMEAIKLFSDPFYRKGPNDQGIGWNILASLQRIAVGFGLAAAIGIPLGFMIGRFKFMSGMFNPIISLLKPVSPLAWLPIGLLVFKAANPAAIWAIFICSIWPMIINTAVGVQRVPQDYMNVARVLNLSEWKILTKILFPSVLPYMLTGVRLAIGTAWLVIVAAEMLTGGVGIGFWVWDEWNNLNVPHIIIAIVVIGVVGLLLEQALVAIAKAFTYEEVGS